MSGARLKTWPVAYDDIDGPVPVTGFAGVRVTPGAACFLAWHLGLRVVQGRGS